MKHIVITCSLLLLFVSPQSSLLAPLVITTVLGLGFGFYNVGTLLAAQNAVGWEHRGVVTSAGQFSRNIGGTLGVSIAGALFTAGVMHVASSSINPNGLLSADARARLSPQDLLALRDVVAGSLRSVFWLFIAVASLATVVAAFLPGSPTVG